MQICRPIPGQVIKSRDLLQTETDVVLDQFMGSGTTILAAEKVARIAAGVEYEPRYVDVAIERWQRMTKLEAVLAGDGRSFEDIGAARAKDRPTITPGDYSGKGRAAILREGRHD